MTTTPRHGAPDLFLSMKNTHKQFVEVFSPVYEPVSSLSAPGPLFADLDFAKDPIQCQPTMCLVNWLRARLLDIPLSTPRNVIERHVRFLLRLQRPVSDAPLQPIVGQHDGYFGI